MTEVLFLFTRVSVVVLSLFSILVIRPMTNSFMEEKYTMKDFMMNSKSPLLIAHRGASGELPENTIPSFKRALEIHPESLLEMDIRQSKDGKIIVSHDSSLERVTNGSGYIKDKTLSELMELDAGYNITFDNGMSFPFRGKGFKLATLEEVFKSFQKTNFIIEIKDNNIDLVKRTVILIREHDATTRVLIGSFHDRVLQEIREQSPDIATGFGRMEAWLFVFLHKLHLGRFYRGNGDVLIVPEYSDTEQPEHRDEGGNGFRVITRKLIDEAHKKGIAVYAWTINRKENMSRLIKWGIDGIISDHPRRLREALEEEVIQK
jgi:glycerophosphoryl diester phosphodiesterase